MRSHKIWLVALLGLASAGCGEKPLEPFKSPDGKFSVMFPGTPKTQDRIGHNDIKFTSFSVEGLSWGYFVTHYDLPGTIKVTPNNLMEILNAEIDGAFRQAQGEKKSSKPVRLQDAHDGIEFAGIFAKPQKMDVRGRMFIVNNRMYNVMVLGSADRVNSDMATEFLGSFKAN
jgi:hypothetical protein